MTSNGRFTYGNRAYGIKAIPKKVEQYFTGAAITEQLNCKNVEWMEKVTEEQYLTGPQTKGKE